MSGQVFLIFILKGGVLNAFKLNAAQKIKNKNKDNEI